MIEHAQASSVENPRKDGVKRAAERPLIVATDGTHECDAAIELAQAFAVHQGTRMCAISVCEPEPVVYESAAFAPVFIPTDPRIDKAERRQEVAQQLKRLLRPDTRYTSYVTTGGIAQEISAHADHIKASVIVAGRGRHGALDRMLGEEHLARLMRLTHCPVLAAEPTLLGVPYRVVVGVDLSEISIDVVRTALSLMSKAGTLHLVHVTPFPPSDVIRFRTLTPYREAAQKRLEQLVGQLVGQLGRVGPTIETDVLMGHAAVGLAAYAEHVKAEMIAVGTHGAGFFNRLMLGSTTTRLLRLASCSLLAVPRPDQPAQN